MSAPERKAREIVEAVASIGQLTVWTDGGNGMFVGIGYARAQQIQELITRARRLVDSEGCGEG